MENAGEYKKEMNSPEPLRCEKLRKAGEGLEKEYSARMAEAKAPDAFKSNGREYPVSSPAELRIAELQQKQKATGEVLNKAREANDYYLEKLSGKFLGFLEAREKTASFLAEAEGEYPELAELMKKEAQKWQPEKQ